jgi:hypothetical protein
LSAGKFPQILYAREFRRNSYHRGASDKPRRMLEGASGCRPACGIDGRVHRRQPARRLGCNVGGTHECRSVYRDVLLAWPGGGSIRLRVDRRGNRPKCHRADYAKRSQLRAEARRQRHRRGQSDAGHRHGRQEQRTTSPPSARKKATRTPAAPSRPTFRA